MQRVSREYKESMASPLRERGYMSVTLGLINQEAQATATIDTEPSEFAYYSDFKSIFLNSHERRKYATLEKNFLKVDGSMIFPFRDDPWYLKCGINPPCEEGLVSEELVSDRAFELSISFNTLPLEIKGLTISFGDNYPTRFDIEGADGQVIRVGDNNKKIWTTETILKDVTGLRLTFYRMKEPDNRLRIEYIKFGLGLVYTNDDILASSLDVYVSPISEDVPQTDFSVRLKNENNEFNIDNPDSPINYLETMQELDVMYGYELPKSKRIEWVRGGRLYCSKWESGENEITICAQDIFRNMDKEYIKGEMELYGKTYYALATDIFNDLGIRNYYIDERLRKISSRNAIPRVKHKEALQIIANATRCSLSQSRNGQIRLESNFIPKIDVTTVNGEDKYSKTKDILLDTTKIDYALLMKDNIKLDGSVLFPPRDRTYALSTGYISGKISDENGKFSTHPILKFSMEMIKAYYTLRLVFGNVLPKSFNVTTRAYGVDVETFHIEGDGINRETVIIRDFKPCDEIVIEFLETEKPYNKIVVKDFYLDGTTNFTIRKEDMLSYPKMTKRETVKEIIVPYYTYRQNSTKETIISEEVDVHTNETKTFLFDEPLWQYSADLEGSQNNIRIVAKGAYYLTVEFKTTGKLTLNIYAYKYTKVESRVVKSLSDRGKTIKWDNPLVSDSQTASDLADWLGKYYSTKIEYEYTTRGNPELDVRDVIYQENDFQKNMLVDVHRHCIEFNQSFSGKITTRRKES